MNSNNDVYLNHMGMVSSLGREPSVVLRRLLAGERGLWAESDWLEERDAYVGRIAESDLAVARGSVTQLGWDSRVNRLLLAALQDIEPQVRSAVSRYGADRVGLVLGTSTSGILESEVALVQWSLQQTLPDDFSYWKQELGCVSEFLAHSLGIEGPSYTLSTACTSSAKAMAAGSRLLNSGLCDAVVVGGADTLCQLTLRGFAALEAMSQGLCSPFSASRDGINIGEAAVLFLMTKEPAEVALCGAGETSDAYHISAPDPAAKGAIAAMGAALRQAGSPNLDYLNLHGTATRQNDAMESRAVSEVLAGTVPVSSTKGLTGHTLGAAGALEAAFCWLLLSGVNTDNALPANVMQGAYDAELPAINLLTEPGQYRRQGQNWMMSNSFAFGGNNIALLFRGEN